MRRFLTSGLLGRPMLDRRGDYIGYVDGTWPLDGSGTPDFVLVRAGRFGERRLVPLDELAELGDLLLAPYSRAEVEDGPAVELGRYLYEQVDRARSYYMLEVELPGAPLGR